MGDIRKTSSSDGPRGVVYDLGTARQARTTATSTPPADSTGVSDEARELSRARAAVDAASDTRAERVRALKAQIQNGTYHPDPQQIAREILNRGF